MIAIKLYPLKFHSILKEKLWAGHKLSTVLGKSTDHSTPWGESWELSDVSGNESVVDGGELHGRSLPSLLEEYKHNLVGAKVYERYENEFPLLVKFIDAADDLSIQVHPNDELAKQRHNSLGKTEMWYVMQADKHSSLITGFNQAITQEDYLKHFKSGTLNSILNKEEVVDHDVFFIPAGRVHTIGKGLLIAEIQQTSDVTYRIYDFDRVDKDGNKRELHLEDVLDAIDYSYHEDYKTHYNTKFNEAVGLVKSEYFETNKIHVTGSIQRDYSELDSFVIYTFVAGQGIISVDDQSIQCALGDVFLIPASCKHVEVKAIDELQFLETFA